MSRHVMPGSNRRDTLVNKYMRVDNADTCVGGAMFKLSPLNFALRLLLFGSDTHLYFVSIIPSANSSCCGRGHSGRSL